MIKANIISQLLAFIALWIQTRRDEDIYVYHTMQHVNDKQR